MWCTKSSSVSVGLLVGALFDAESDCRATRSSVGPFDLEKEGGHGPEDIKLFCQGRHGAEDIKLFCQSNSTT